MQKTKAFCQWCWRRFVVAVACIIILLALIFSSVRIALPFLTEWKQEIETTVSQKIGYDVDIEDVKVSWEGLYPQAHFINSQVSDKDVQLLSIGELIVSLDVLRSISSFSAKLHKITIVNTHIKLERDKDQQWLLNKIQLEQNEKEAEKKIEIPKQLQNIIVSTINSRLTFADQAKSKTYFFDNLSITAKNNKQNYDLFISSNLPSPLGQRFDIGLKLKGDINALQTMTGQAYANVDQLDMADLPLWVPEAAFIKQGILSGEVWFDLGDKKPDFFADLQADKISIDTGKIKDKSFAGIRGDINRVEITGLFKKNDQLYQAFLPNVKFYDDINQATESFSDELLLSINLNEQTALDQFRVSYNEVSLQVMQKIITFLPSSNFKDNLKKIELLGAIQQGFLACQNLEEGIDCVGQSQFDKINYVDQKEKSYLKGFSGELVYKDRQLYANHKSQNVEVNLPSLFAKPISLDKLSGKSWFNVDTNSVMLRELNVQQQSSVASLDMDVEISKKNNKVDRENSFIRLLADLENVPAQDALLFLPLKKMDADLSKWIKQAFKPAEGLINTAKIVVDANFENYKSRTEKVWQVSGTVDNVAMRFHEDWPVIRDLNAYILIGNVGLFVDSKSADILGTRLFDSYVWIDSYDEKVLYTQLNSDGRAEDLYKMVKQSPIADGKEDILKEISVTGQQSSQGDFYIPFREGAEPFIDIQMVLRKVNLHEKVSDIRVSKVGQEVTAYLSESAFVTEPFKAQVNKVPSTLVVNSHQLLSTGLIYTDIHTDTQMPAAEFWPDHVSEPPFWLADIKGKSKQYVRLRLPLNVEEVEAKHKLSAYQKYPSVYMQTNNKGFSIDLPAPANKLSSQTYDVNVNLLLMPDSQMLTDVVAGSDIKAKILTAIEDDDLRINAAHIVTNGDKPSLDNKQGIHVEGELLNLNLDAWLEYLDQQPDSSEPNPVLDAIRDVKLNVSEFAYLDRAFKNVQLGMQQDTQYWLINVKHKSLSGDVRLPKENVQESDVFMRFDFVDMNKMPPESTEESDINPKDVPLFQASVGRFEIDDFKFNNVTLRTSRALHGIKIDELSVNDPNLNTFVQGSWINTLNNKSETQLTGQITTENLGEGIKSIGYADLMNGGAGTADFSLRWSDNPMAFGMDKIRGRLNAEFKEGNILAIDPGAGRLFSLVSLNELPKRLILDFKDVGSKGLYFEKMSGSFEFADGIAHTPGFRIRTTIGKMDITGDTYLLKQTYDQELRFLPDLSSSLPIIGTILGGGNTGVGVLVLDGIARLFGGQLDNIGEKRYKITGSWDEPKIEPIIEVQTNGEDAEYEFNEEEG